jgi:hypothetical protein
MIFPGFAADGVARTRGSSLDSWESPFNHRFSVSETSQKRNDLRNYSVPLPAVEVRSLPATFTIEGELLSSAVRHRRREVRVAARV